MRIAVDAMGGDFAPREIVAGAVRAAALESVSRLFLVGDKSALEAELAKARKVPASLEIRHASEVVAMDEHPAMAIRKKKDSSISRAMDMVKEGEADAFVSAGNTGACMVAATLKLRTIEGIERPAIATVMPTQKTPFILIDAGANTDCEPRFLQQFAVMGTIYAQEILGRADPVVGLMSIGGEDTKGNELSRAAFQLLSKSGLNFRGNVEGHDLFRGETDVVVCDGFVGNAALKICEGMAEAIGSMIKQEVKGSLMAKLAYLLARGAVNDIKKKLDYSEYGGAPLLGVDGVVIIGHGRSTAKAVKNAVRLAHEYAQIGLPKLLVQSLEENQEPQTQGGLAKVWEQIKEKING
jgi:glycerol-3-phosphate acyltransferase PlsX